MQTFIKRTSNKLIVISLISMLIILMGSVAFGVDLFDLKENNQIHLWANSAHTIPVTDSTYTYDTTAHEPYVTIDGYTSGYKVSYQSNVNANGGAASDVVTHPYETTEQHSGAAYVIIEPEDGDTTFEHFAIIPFGIQKMDLATADANGDIDFQITGSKIYDGAISHPTITKSEYTRPSDNQVIDLDWDVTFADVAEAVNMFDVTGYYVCINGYRDNSGFHAYTTNTNYSGYIVRYVGVFPAPVTCTWSSDSPFTYNGTDQYITSTLNGAVGNEVLVGNPTHNSGAASIDVGDYTANDVLTSIDISGVTDATLLALYNDLANTYGYNIVNNYRMVENASTYTTAVTAIFPTYEAYANANGATDTNAYMNANHSNLWVTGFEEDYEIEGAPLTVTANSFNDLVVGDPMPSFAQAFTVTGEVNGETAVKTGNITSTVTSTAAVANGTTSASAANLANGTGTNKFKVSNYDITYVNGTIVVSAAPTKPLTVTATSYEIYYGEPLPTPYGYTVSGDYTGTPAFTPTNPTCTATTTSDAGSYPIKADGVMTAQASGTFDPADYTITYVDGTLTIKAIPISGDPTPEEYPDIHVYVKVTASGTYTYNGGEWTPEPTVELYNKDTDTKIRNLVKNTEYTVSYENNVSVGNPSSANPPTVVVTGVGPNFTSSEKVPFTINPKPIAYVWSDREFVYDTQEHIAKATIDTGVTGETIVFTTATAMIPVGNNYPAIATATGVDGGEGSLDNYTITNNQTTFKITPIHLPDEPDPDPDPEPGKSGDNDVYVKIYVSGEGISVPYDGTEKEPDNVTVTEVVLDKTTGAEISRRPLTEGTDYTLDWENNINAANSGDTVHPSILVIGDGTNVIGTTYVPFTITPAELTVTAEDKDKNYGDPDPDLTYTLDGLVGTETPIPTGALTRVAGEDVANSPYEIQIGTLDFNDNDPFFRSNYTITYVSGDLTIFPSSVEETPDPSDFPDQKVRVKITVDGEYTYDGTPHCPPPVVKLYDGDDNFIRDLVSGEDYTVSWDNNIDAGKSGDPVNVPTVTVTGINNFTQEETVPFTINPCPITIKASDETKYYKDPDPTFSGEIVSGGVAGEVPAITNPLTRESGETVKTPPYVVYLTEDDITDNGAFKKTNYDITTQNGSLNILPVDLPSDTVPEDPSDPTGPQKPKVTVEVTGTYTYSGDEKKPEPVVKMTLSDGTEITLVSGEDYTVDWDRNIHACPSGDPNAPIVIVSGIDPNTLNEIIVPFTIDPRPLEVTWDPKDEFMYDGQEHIRVGTVDTGLPTETPIYTIAERQTEANSGDEYTAVITITGIDGGQLSDYIMPEPAELERPFHINKLPISTTPDQPEDTEEPLDPSDPTPEEGKPDDYKVYLIITWPDEIYTYTGTPHRPVPDSVELVIEDPAGNIVSQTPVDPSQYTISYTDNINADETGTNPTATLTGTGNFTGTVDYNFPIMKAPLTVKADNKTKKMGKENPPLTYTVTGAVNNEEPSFTGELETTATIDSKKGTYPIYCDGKLTPQVNGDFNPENYNITYVDGILTVKKKTDPIPGDPTPSDPTPSKGDIDVSIFLSNGQPKNKKGNNNYYLLGEEVIYYVDYENEEDAFTSTYKLVLELPLKFDVVDADGGKVDSSAKTITWTIPGGMKKNETGRKTVKVKFTAFSSGNKSGYEDIYPVDRIFIGTKEYDECTVHNIIYTLDNDINTKHIIYMYGDEEKPTFRPDHIINRAEGALVLTRIFEINTSNVAIQGDEFTDIGDTYLKAQQAIVKASQLGLISGYQDGSYRPLQKMTRAEFMSIISRFVEYKSTQEGMKGMDIKEIQKDNKLYKKAGHWADKYILLLARLNMAPEDITTSEELDRKITRAEVAQLCNMYLLRAPVYDDGKIELPFDDVDSSHKLFGDIVEATRPSHNDFRLTENAYEIWDR